MKFMVNDVSKITKIKTPQKDLGHFSNTFYRHMKLTSREDKLAFLEYQQSYKKALAKKQIFNNLKC